MYKLIEVLILEFLCMKSQRLNAVLPVIHASAWRVFPQFRVLLYKICVDISIINTLHNFNRTQLRNHLVIFPLNVELHWKPEKMGHLHIELSRVEEVLAWKFLTKLPMHWLHFLNHNRFSVGHQKEILVVGFYVQTHWSVDLGVSLYEVPKHWMLCSLWYMHQHEGVSPIQSAPLQDLCRY